MSRGDTLPWMACHASRQAREPAHDLVQRQRGGAAAHGLGPVREHRERAGSPRRARRADRGTRASRSRPRVSAASRSRPSASPPARMASAPSRSASARARPARAPPLLAAPVGQERHRRPPRARAGSARSGSARARWRAARASCVRIRMITVRAGGSSSVLRKACGVASVMRLGLVHDEDLHRRLGGPERGQPLELADARPRGGRAGPWDSCSGGRGLDQVHVGVHAARDPLGGGGAAALRRRRARRGEGERGRLAARAGRAHEGVGVRDVVGGQGAARSTIHRLGLMAETAAKRSGSAGHGAPPAGRGTRPPPRTMSPCEDVRIALAASKTSTRRLSARAISR